MTGSSGWTKMSRDSKTARPLVCDWESCMQALMAQGTNDAESFLKSSVAVA
jgi:hypothetical protein